MEEKIEKWEIVLPHPSGQFNHIFTCRCFWRKPDFIEKAQLMKNPNHSERRYLLLLKNFESPITPFEMGLEITNRCWDLKKGTIDRFREGIVRGKPIGLG